MFGAILALGATPSAVGYSVNQSNTNYAILRGINRAGMEFPDWTNYNVNSRDFDYMTTVFPRMNCVELDLKLNLLMPNSLEGDYVTINYTYAIALDQWVSWSAPKGIKIIMGLYYWSTNYYGYYPSDLFTNPQELKVVQEFFKFLAQRYLSFPNMIGFDIINEPKQGNQTGVLTIAQYETFVEAVIDAFRQVNPNLVAYVQTTDFDSRTGFSWVENAPIERPNVVYVTHLYCHDWATGAWDLGTPWAQYYIDGNYAEAFNLLKDALYARFGFLRDLGYNVLVAEFAAPLNQSIAPGSLRYLEDVIRILESWGISWTYYSWGSEVPNVLFHLVKGGGDWQTLNPQADVLKPYIGTIAPVRRS
jgi:hypothetical protein